MQRHQPRRGDRRLHHRARREGARGALRRLVPRGCAGLADEAHSWFSAPATLLVNNAGVGAGGTRIGDTPIEEWTQVLGINLNGVIHGCHVFVPILRAAGHGGVVNVASAASFTSAPTMGPDNASNADGCM